MRLDKVNDIGFFGDIIDIHADALQGIEYGCVGAVDVAVSACDFIDRVFTLSATAQHERIDAFVLDRVVGHDSEWRHMIIDTTSPLDKAICAHIASFMHQSVGGEDRVVGDVDISCNFHSIAEHAEITDM